MKYTKLDAIDIPLSRWGQGCMMLTTDARKKGFSIMDQAFERGVTVFDNAHVYEAGECERVFGEWMASTGNREKIVILSKGCHDSIDRKRVTPHDITSDLMDSLSRMRVECVDIWMFHRDDPTQDVGPLVEELNRHINAGRIKVIGASNWSIPRINQFNTYAKEHGLKGIETSSPNFSLAEQIESPWGADCITISGPSHQEDRRWYTENGMPVFTWSSLARGFFSGRVNRDNYLNVLEDHAVKAYVCEDNWLRLSRAQELAKQKNMSVAQIALAYVFNQSFNAFALASAYTEQEADANLAALNCDLSDHEMAWLDLR